MRLLILSFCVILTGCGWFTKEKSVVVNVPKSEIFHPPLPPKLNLIQPDKWIVLPEGTVTPKTVYAVTPKGYEILSLNLAELRRYIQDLRSLLQYYRNLKTVDTQPSITSEQPVSEPTQ